ncbi:DUF1738 domain-containing protein [Palleniella muris]|uniref:DUF1738 domain-containing protein n=1 Tax=Palleniella muris TaxID=3038145 RepID=A0AC61QQM8_9BACT|nr:ssDNA-binding domain-containing protein [Palleniella muris]TGX82612.1 DUF1738 domain-containing protein [Palleniella muris]
MKQTNYEEKALQQFADLMIDKISEIEKSNWQKPWFTESLA